MIHTASNSIYQPNLILLHTTTSISPQDFHSKFSLFSFSIHISRRLCNQLPFHISISLIFRVIVDDKKVLCIHIEKGKSLHEQFSSFSNPSSFTLSRFFHSMRRRNLFFYSLGFFLCFRMKCYTKFTSQFCVVLKGVINIKSKSEGLRYLNWESFLVFIGSWNFLFSSLFLLFSWRR